MTIEHQAEVDEVAVVLAQAHGRVGCLPIRFGGIRADTDQYRVPKSFHAQLAKDFGCLLRGLVFGDACAHARADAMQRRPAFVAGELHPFDVVAFADGLARCSRHAVETQGELLAQ